MYKVFRDMETVMFPSRAIMLRYLPRVFKTIKKIRCIVDCTEFSVETSQKFARQGNTYILPISTHAFKCLIAITPNGGACFVSDLHEGDIDDVQLFKKCGILKHINSGDIVMANCRFTVQHLLNPLHAQLKIPSFLKGRANHSAAGEIKTRKIGKAQIQVEQFNDTLSSFVSSGEKYHYHLLP